MNDGSNNDSYEGSSTSPTQGKTTKKVQEDSHLCNKDNQAQGTTTEDEYDDSLANYSLMEQDDQLSDTEDNYLLSQSITLK